MIGISCEGPEIFFGRKGAVPTDERIVELIEDLARLSDAFVGNIVKLSPKDQPYRVPDCHHSSDARGGTRRKGCRLEAVAVANDDSPVAVSIGTVLDAGEGFRVEDLGWRRPLLVLRNVCALG